VLPSNNPEEKGRGGEENKLYQLGVEERYKRKKEQHKQVEQLDLKQEKGTEKFRAFKKGSLVGVNREIMC